MEIQKAKILKSKKDNSVRTLEVDYTTTDKEGKVDYHSDNCGGAIHSDLFDAFQELAVHFGIIGEEIPAGEVVTCEKYDRDLVSALTVTSFSYADEESGVTISGYKTLATGRIKQFNVFTKLEEIEDAYDHVVHLNTCLRRVKYEIKQYTEGKYAEDPQLDLFDDKTKTVVEVLDPETGSSFEAEKTKKGKKKKEVAES